MTASLPFRSVAIRRVALVVLPLAVVALDVAAFPAVLSTWHLQDSVNVLSLVQHRALQLGTFRAHRLHVMLDNLRSASSLAGVSEQRRALVVSHFIDPDSGESTVGALGQAVLWRLAQAAPEDERLLRDRLDATADQRPGDVIEVPLRGARVAQFPVDTVFVVLLEAGPSGGDAGRAAVARGLQSVLNRAANGRVGALVIPCVAYNWQDKNSIRFDDLFEPLFAALPTASAPRDIYLSLYADWPTFVLEEAVASLNRSLHAHAADAGSLAFYRAEIRSTLILLSVCLFACSFVAPLTLKNFAIICCAFVGAAAGARKTIDFFTQDYSDAVRTAIRVIALAGLAAGFPFIVNWNPKQVFEKANPARPDYHARSH